MNQITTIESWLLDGKSITSYESFEKFGCTRLSAKIFELRKKGLIIDTIREQGTNKEGVQCYYYRYYVTKKNIAKYKKEMK